MIANINGDCAADVGKLVIDRRFGDAGRVEMPNGVRLFGVSGIENLESLLGNEETGPVYPQSTRLRAIFAVFTRSGHMAVGLENCSE